MSNISKETLWRIQADARAIPEEAGPVKTGYIRAGYQAGAVYEAEKAQGLVEALEFIFRMTNPGTPERNAAETALAKYKEVSNG